MNSQETFVLTALLKRIHGGEGEIWVTERFCLCGAKQQSLKFEHQRYECCKGGTGVCTSVVTARNLKAVRCKGK